MAKVVSINGQAWVRTSMSRGVYVPYKDIEGNTISYDDASGGSAYEWYCVNTNSFASSDQLISTTTSQKKIDFINSLRDFNGRDVRELNWFEKMVLMLMAKLSLDSTFFSSNWFWILVIIIAIYFVFKIIFFKKGGKK